LAVLILEDELDYEPFTENRQWPSGKIKIARPFPPATACCHSECLIRGQAVSGTFAEPSTFCHKVLNWLTYLNGFGGGWNGRESDNFGRVSIGQDGRYARKSRSFQLLSH
jgi:hypothetical protein